MFESRSDLEYYCSLVSRLRVINDLTSVDQQAILAYIILFNMNGDENVSHISKVKERTDVDLLHLFNAGYTLIFSRGSMYQCSSLSGGLWNQKFTNKFQRARPEEVALSQFLM